MSAHRSVSSQAPHGQHIQDNNERESSFPGVSFLLSSEAPARNLYLKDRDIQSGSQDLLSKCKRTISQLKMHSRDTSYYTGPAVDYGYRLHPEQLVNHAGLHEERYYQQQGDKQNVQVMQQPQNDIHNQQVHAIARNIDVLRLEYKVKELEGVIVEMTAINQQLQKCIQSSNSEIVTLTKALEASEINLLEKTNNCTKLSAQLQRAQDDILIREQQALSKGQMSATEGFERVKKTFEQQLEVRKVQAIQSTKLFKTTVADAQKEIDKLQKKLEASEKHNKSLEGLVQQKEKIIVSLGVKRSREIESAIEEKDAQIAALQQALKEYKKTFKQEDRIVKDLSSRESALHDRVVLLQEENQRLHLEIKKVMRITSSEVKSLVEERKQRDVVAQEKEEQYERFLQVQQRQVERFQRELKMALKAKRNNPADRSPPGKRAEAKQVHQNCSSGGGSCSTRPNKSSTSRAKRSTSSQLIPSRKVMHSMPNEREFMSQNPNNTRTQPHETEVTLRNKKARVNSMQSEYNIEQTNQERFNYPAQAGDITYFMQDTLIDGVESSEQRQHMRGGDEQIQLSYQNRQDDYEDGEENKTSQYNEDNTIHERIAELQKQLIYKQNENLTLQAQLFQESKNLFLDVDSECEGQES